MCVCVCVCVWLHKGVGKSLQIYHTVGYVGVPHDHFVCRTMHGAPTGPKLFQDKVGSPCGF